MAFKTYIYESERATSYKIRLDTDQAAISGAVVSGATTEGFHVKVNKSSRAFGLNPRHLSLKRFVGVAPNDRPYYTRLAICTQAAFDAIAEGSNVSINSINWTVDRKVTEQRR